MLNKVIVDTCGTINLRAMVRFGLRDSKDMPVNMIAEKTNGVISRFKDLHVEHMFSICCLVHMLMISSRSSMGRIRNMVIGKGSDIFKHICEYILLLPEKHHMVIMIEIVINCPFQDV